MSNKYLYCENCDIVVRHVANGEGKYICQSCGQINSESEKDVKTAKTGTYTYRYKAKTKTVKGTHIDPTEKEYLVKLLGDKEGQ